MTQGQVEKTYAIICLHCRQPIPISPEVAERHGGSGRPARFWGLALVVEDLDRTVAMLGEHVSEARPAVQTGRRIASVRRSAGLAVPLALMSARVSSRESGHERSARPRRASGAEHVDALPGMAAQMRA